MSLTEFDQKEYDRHRRKEAWDDGVAWQKAQSEKTISAQSAEIARLKAQLAAVKATL